MPGNTAKGRNAPITKDKPLTPKERLFIDKYIETGNAKQSAIYAGYKERSAAVFGCELLKKVNVAEEIRKRQEKMTKKSIATAQQVMEYLTQVMNGEIKDQFGLDAPLSERTRAATELAKRTVDLENRLNGKPDNVVQIKLDWSRKK
jgi:phage terminase small subunit